MDQSTLVSGQGQGVSQGTNPSQPRDAGADDLDARLNARIQETANGFRSVLDKRFAGIEPAIRQLPQLQAQVNQMNQALQTINGYFQAARDAELDPEERNRQQVQRSQLAMAERERAVVHNARQQNAAFNALLALQELDMKWGDPRIDWNSYNQLYQDDPNAWTNAIVVQANKIKREEEAAARQTQVQTQRQAQETRAQEIQAQQRVDSQNAQRAAAAAMVTPVQPSGDTADWKERVNQMDRKERLEWIRRVQSGLVHGEVSHPNQVR